MALIRGHMSSFAWKPSDMSGIDPRVMTHKLNVLPEARPVKQKKRVVGRDKQQATREEVQKLEKAGFIREVMYPQWLANPVLVKKANGKYRMCIDFTDLNQACPKDCYPLPDINKMFDSTAGFDYMSSLDAMPSYH